MPTLPTLPTPWRPEDELLLQRLEDETVTGQLLAHLVGLHPPGAPRAQAITAAPDLHPRAGGLISEVRRIPDGPGVVEAALAGQTEPLVRLLDDLVLRAARPELLHHLALLHGKVAAALEGDRPELAASAWVRSLAAWIALSEERAYLTRLEQAIAPQRASTHAPAGIRPEDVPLEVISEIARRADVAARDLSPPGRAALLALARTGQAASLAGASPAAARRIAAFAERRRNAAIEAALAVIGEAIDEANVRGELTTAGRTLLLRAIPVWSWTANDEAVEHFVIERIDKIGWELYRARRWDDLRYLLDPFRPLFDSLGRRIEADPTRIAYAAGAAQMFVFMSEVDTVLARKIELGERALRICPTHRNGRLVLAAYLCDDAIESMKKIVVFARKDEIGRIEATLARAESLYPQSSGLPDAKQMLERVKRGRIAV